MKARDSGRRTGLRALSAAAVIAALGTVGVTTGSVASSASIRPATTATHLVAMPYATSVPKAVGIPKHGNFDCNGYSSAHETVEHAYACTDIRGFLGVDNANTWGGKFYDNGRYIGHDEPDLTFLSTKAGSGDNVTWNETLPADPSATPGTTSPGHDVSHWFELSPAPWFSMMMCDPYSYPQLACTPQSDSNAPSCPQAFQCPANAFPGGG
ncbi:MAG TPA: hypothetical protein VGS21_01505, partial [Acidimicrobiales bacterium]|nr:hypothetical protein [Acidimicrobiales bacterium]